MVNTIRKRDGRIVKFNEQKIINAILAAFKSVDGDISDYAISKATNIASFIAGYYEEVEETPVEIKKVNKLLSCNAHFKETGFIYTVEVTSKYTDSQVQHTQLKYVIQLDTASGLTFEDVAIPEYDNISSIESKGIKTQKNIDQFIVEIDYRLDESLRDNEFLEKHSKMITIQRQSYQDESFQCVITEGSNENN